MATYTVITRSEAREVASPEQALILLRGYQALGVEAEVFDVRRRRISMIDLRAIAQARSAVHP